MIKEGGSLRSVNYKAVPKCIICDTEVCKGIPILSYSSNDDLSSLVVDADGQMARFVTKTLRCVAD